MHLSPAAIEGAIRLLYQRGAVTRFGDIVETGPTTAANTKTKRDFGCGGPQPSIPTALYIVAA